MKKNIAWTAFILLVLSPNAWAGEWQQLNPGTTPGARYGHSMVVLNGKITLCGGMGPQETVEKGPLWTDVWEWDDLQDKWDEVKPANSPPPARYFHSAAVINGKMYVFFGQDAGGSVLSDAWCLDPATKNWEQLSYGGQVPSARYLHSAATLSDGESPSMAMFGGDGEAAGSDTQGELDTQGGIDSNAWVYEPFPGGGGYWTKKAAMPGDPRYGQTCVVVNGKLYVFGGSTSEGPLNDMWKYDPVADSWEKITPANDPPPPRWLHAAALWETGMWIMGGMGDGGSELSDTWKFDFTTSTWSRGPDMILGLSQAGAGIVSSGRGLEVILFGGKNGTTVEGGTYRYVIGEDFPWALFSPAFRKRRGQ